MLRRLAVLSLAAAVALSFAAPLAAQWDYPNKPIRIVVPYPPGGATDITARAYAQDLTEVLGQPVIVEHRPGGGTNIGAEYVARAAPDGYTLYVANFASHAVNRWLWKKLPFDPVADFTPIAMMVRGPMFLCVRPGLEVNNVGELVEMAKKNPGKLTYGSTGNGSPNHISGELLKHLAKIDVVHVPYKGSANLNANILNGQVDYGFDASIIAMHHNKQVRCIGVASNFRWPTEKDLPTLAESGVPGFDLSSFFGIVGPKGVPQPIVEKLNAAFREVGQRPDLAKRLTITGTVPFPATIEETRAFLKEQDSKWAPIVEASGARVD
jgi:tripartite-type tricarboxylate transporter receptor subunit TctC